MIGIFVRNKQDWFVFWKDRILLMLMMMISSQTVVFGTNSIGSYSTFVNISILFFSFYFFLINTAHKTSINKENNKVLYILVVCLFLSGLVNFEISIEYIIRLGIILAAFYYVGNVSFLRFRKAYEDVMLLLVLWSLAFYIVSIAFPSFLFRFDIVINSANISFYNCFLCVIPATGEVDRLYGPFREPGVFQIFINIALLFHFVETEKIKYWKVVIFFTSIIFTFSTTGYFCLIIIVLYYVISLGRKQNRRKDSVILLVTFGASLYFLYTLTDLFSIEGVVFGKLFDPENESSLSRYGSIVANIKLFCENPLFGVGFETVSELFPSYVRMVLGEESVDNTNSILMNFATTGFLYGVTYLVGFWKLSQKISYNIITSIIIFFVFCLLLSGENITRFIITYILFFYGFKPQSIGLHKGSCCYK